MVTEQFTEQMRTEGRTLTKALNEAGLRVTAALWYYFEEANEWRYVFISPVVEAVGHLGIYKKVLKIIRGSDEGLVTFGASNVVALSNKQPLAERLHKQYGISIKSREARSPHRVEERFVGDAYIYKTTNGKEATPV